MRITKVFYHFIAFYHLVFQIGFFLLFCQQTRANPSFATAACSEVLTDPHGFYSSSFNRENSSPGTIRIRFVCSEGFCISNFWEFRFKQLLKTNHAMGNRQVEVSHRGIVNTSPADLLADQDVVVILVKLDPEDLKALKDQGRKQDRHPLIVPTLEKKWPRELKKIGPDHSLEEVLFDYLAKKYPSNS